MVGDAAQSCKNRATASKKKTFYETLYERQTFSLAMPRLSYSLHTAVKHNSDFYACVSEIAPVAQQMP